MNTNITEVREKMINSIITRLGGNMIDVELDNDTLQKCIDLAEAKLIQRGDAYVEESLVLLTLKKNQKEYKKSNHNIYFRCYIIWNRCYDF